MLIWRNSISVERRNPTPLPRCSYIRFSGSNISETSDSSRWIGDHGQTTNCSLQTLYSASNTCCHNGFTRACAFERVSSAFTISLMAN